MVKIKNLKVEVYTLTILALLLAGCHATKQIASYESDTLKIRQIAPHTYIHTSYLETATFGKVPCNGMLVADEGEALVFDTPVNNSDAEELLNWVESTLKSKVTGVVITHFHVDCLGGLEVFHDRNIASYASSKTINLATPENEIIPENGFEQILELKVGKKKVINEFLGEGHTVDNIVSYYPQDKILFGGCLIKSLGAGKGNLADANVDEWSNTVKKVKEKFGEAKLIIPGHGKHGGTELLDYTIEKFANK